VRAACGCAYRDTLFDPMPLYKTTKKRNHDGVTGVAAASRREQDRGSDPGGEIHKVKTSVNNSNNNPTNANDTNNGDSAGAVVDGGVVVLPVAAKSPQWSAHRHPSPLEVQPSGRGLFLTRCPCVCVCVCVTVF